MTVTMAVAMVVVALCSGAAGSPLLSAQATKPAQGDEPYGLHGYLAPAGPLWVRWNALEADIRAEAKILAACRADRARCRGPADLFLAIVDDARARAGRARLEAITRAVNLAFRNMNLPLEGTDQWTAPLATLAIGRAACMEVAVAKDVALREAGLAAADRRILLTWDMRARLYHAFATARQDGRWFLLDNRTSFVVEDVDQRGDVPMFSLSHEGVKQFHPPSPPGGFRLRDYLDISGGLPCRSQHG